MPNHLAKVICPPLAAVVVVVIVAAVVVAVVVGAAAGGAALLPWDLPCSPGRIAWKGDKVSQPASQPWTDFATTRPVKMHDWFISYGSIK